MGLSAGVTIVFYNDNGEKIDTEYIDYHKCEANGNTFTVPTGTYKAKAYFSTEDDQYYYSDSSDSDVEEWHQLEVEKLLATCREEIGTNVEKLDYWQQLKCKPEIWNSFLCAKVVELEKDDSDYKTLNKLSAFEDFVDDFIYNQPPQSLLEVLEYMTTIELLEGVDDYDFDYKPLAKIIMDCFEKASQKTDV